MNKQYFKLNFIVFVFNMASLIFSVDVKNLPSPYCNLTELLPFNNHGWYVNRYAIEQLFKNNKISRVIEVGSWLGLSTRHIASLLPDGGYVYAVDTWEGSAEHEINPNWKVLLPTLYVQFLSNVVHAKLTDKIIPVKMTSLQAAQYLKSEIENIDLIYIDGAHDSLSVLKDLQAYYPYVQGKHGILCGDDWMCEDVESSVIKFAKSNHLSVYHLNRFWILKEESYTKLKDLYNQPDLMWQII